MLKFNTLIILFTLIGSTIGYAQKERLKTTETLRLQSEDQSKSRGINPNFEFASSDPCNKINTADRENDIYDEMSCVKVENLTNVTVSIYMNGELNAIIPPFSLLDIVPVLSDQKNEYFAIALLEEEHSLTWGPWEQVPNSCLMVLLE